MARLLIFFVALSIALFYVEGFSSKFSPNLVGKIHRGQSGHSKRYINSWAVQVRGGKVYADEVARRHGFENRGEVPGFSDIYQFVLTGPEKSKIRSDTPYATGLELENRVHFAEQQYYEERVTKSYVIPQDPLFVEQWNLLNTGFYGEKYDGNDLNVEPAWLQGITGCNVTVAIVDNGLDFRHPDIWPNFAPTVSHDFVDDDFDPLFYRTTHGTSCGGIVGGAHSNLFCGVGIAYDSNIGGLRLLPLSGGTNDMQEGMALSHERDIIDIYSNSWGPSDAGFIVEGPRTMAQMALRNGTSKGRNGKGSIYVWANGNGGFLDNCAADGFASSIYTISVGAIGVIGTPSNFDEECSAKMVTAYVTDPHGYSTIRTTKTGAVCTLEFSGTSAATPMVSGAIALALEANPGLTWRDVQYLIVYTANPQLTNLTDTQLNGADLAVSHQYGFGVMDAEAMVTRARHWINVPPQMNDTLTGATQEQTQYLEIVNYTGQIQYMEHVVVRISVEAVGDIERGDLVIKLTSPAETESVLLRPRLLDHSVINGGEKAYVDWPFMSVMFWGEDPTGQWILNINSISHGVINVSKVEFEFYGVSQVPEAVANIPDQCHDDCSRGCAREGSDFCDSCFNLRNAYTLECIDQCPSGYTERNGYCYDASLPVKQCDSPLKSKEGTGFTEEYEDTITCAESQYTECCTATDDEDDDCTQFHPRNCFCDETCHEFGDCCEDAADIGCEAEEKIAFFSYFDLGVTPGIETHYSAEEPVYISFPYIFSIYSHVTVTMSGRFRFSEPDEDFIGFSVFEGNYFSGSVMYEVHQGAHSKSMLSLANSMINTLDEANFVGTWMLIATWQNMTQSEGDLTNTFQGILVTDFNTSYIIVTYRCGDMEFSNPGRIGFYIGNDITVLVGASKREKPHLYSCINEPDTAWVNQAAEITGAENDCLVDNGGCEQICIDTFLSNDCDCKDGYVLDSDGVSCSPEPVELQFAGDTPLVTGSNISVIVHVSPPRPLRCQLISRGAPGMPIRAADEDCSSGEIVFQNVSAGEHRVRVIAGNKDAAIRSHVILMPDSPFFCSLNAVNSGVIKHYYNGTVAFYTIEWQPIGDDVGYLCDFGITEYAGKCSSPYTFAAEEGVTRVKVFPDPEKCRGIRRPYVFRLE